MYCLCLIKGQGIGDVTVSTGEGLTAITTAEGVYVLNNVTAGGYTIQVGKQQTFIQDNKLFNVLLIPCAESKKQDEEDKKELR